jgi:hypothetical protein
VLRDYHELMNLAGYQDVIAKDADTALKVNISWHFFFPGSSTTPWQLEGVIRAMKADGYSPDLLHACHNRTVVIDAHLGERENKQVNVVEAHGLRNVHLYEGEEWITIGDAVGDLTKKFLCLNEVYPRGFMIPRGSSARTSSTSPREDPHLHDDHRRDEERVRGAAERAPALDAPGHPRDPRGPADDPEEDPPRRVRRDGRHVRRRRPGPALHGAAREERPPREQRPGGDRRGGGEADGPRPAVDQVHPLAHDLGLGCGDPREIEIVGDVEAAQENWHFEGPFRKMTFASRMQHKIYWGPLKKPIEWSLKTVLAPWAYMASVVYHDSFWYPVKARYMMEQVLDSDWGRLFRNWETLAPDANGFPTVGADGARIERTGFKAFTKSLGILGTCIREAPEFSNRRRKVAGRVG